MYLPVIEPHPGVDDGPFWEFCRRRELHFQRCADCGRFRHPPGPCCPHCLSFRSDWQRAPQTGEIFSFTVVHHAVNTEMRAYVPYNIAVVAFPECGGVRLVSNVVGAGPDELRIGQKVRLVWETLPSGLSLPRFARHPTD